MRIAQEWLENQSESWGLPKNHLGIMRIAWESLKNIENHLRITEDQNHSELLKLLNNHENHWEGQESFENCLRIMRMFKNHQESWELPYNYQKSWESLKNQSIITKNHKNCLRIMRITWESWESVNNHQESWELLENQR